MKHLKRFNEELSPETYRSVADKRDEQGMSSSASKLREYADLVQKKMEENPELREKLISAVDDISKKANISIEEMQDTEIVKSKLNKATNILAGVLGVYGLLAPTIGTFTTAAQHGFENAMYVFISGIAAYMISSKIRTGKMFNSEDFEQSYGSDPR